MKAANGGRDDVTGRGKTQIEATVHAGKGAAAESFHGHNASTAMDDPRVAAAMQVYLEALEAGAALPRDVFLAEHSAIAKELAECLDGLALVHEAARSIKDVGGNEGPLTADELKLPLGDFRVLREIGRGGMGIVYEAVQLSLGRRVALKVLPLSAALDPKHLQRFKNEAQAAAALHHTNIVPVYAVGSERGVHYYSMQLIDGYSLADLIEHRRQLLGKSSAVSDPAGNQPTEKAIPLAPPILRVPGRAGGTTAKPSFHDVTEAFVAPPPIAAVAAPPIVETATKARSSTIRTASERNTSTYFRTIAGLIRQAALALDHAHQSGVIHRDIKPANLLLDERGNLWVTDFGLAQFQANMQLTRTGDMLGTLRYMSPEQARGDRVVLDHRTDIYSLGVTLYELLTLEPAIDGDEPHTLLRRVIDQEPRSPRVHDKHIPPELETIVLKSMAKSPAERYPTAGALADDLERWLEDKPIKARRPTLMELAARWGRRHWAVATAAAGVLAVATLGLLLSIILLSMAHTDTQAAYNREKVQSEMAERQRKAADESFRQARQAVDSFLQISEEELAGKPSLHETRRRFLQTALTYYNDFLEKRKNDPAVRDELAKSSQWATRIAEELAALERFASFMLLTNREVQADIKLTAAQREELSSLLSLVGSSGPDGMPRLNEAENVSVAEQVKALEEKISQVLSTQQVKRLSQIELQRRGPFAFKSAEVAKALNLTAEQRKRINAIIEEEAPQRRGEFDHGPPGEHGPGGGKKGGPGGFGPPGPPPPRGGEWDFGGKGGEHEFGGPKGKGKGPPPRGGEPDPFGVSFELQPPGDPFGGDGFDRPPPPPPRGKGGGEDDSFGLGGKRGMFGEGKGGPPGGSRGEKMGGKGFGGPGGPGGPGARGGPGGEKFGGPPPREFERPPPRDDKGGKGLGPGEFGPSMRRAVHRILALLTPEQKAKWEELVGPEFQHELPWRPE
jgi:serine/threonine protein kinase